MDVDTTGCVPYQPGVETNYGYVPSKAAGITFITLFSLSTLLHLSQTIRSRQWWTLLFAIGGLTEVIGWTGRTWSALCPYNTAAFLMQITTLIIAPTFWTAALYLLLGTLTSLPRAPPSPLRPHTYLALFLSADLVSLLLQAIGGGMASVAAAALPPGDTAPGTRIMVGGILFQLAAMTVFVGLIVAFVVRGRGRRLGGRVRCGVGAMAGCAGLVYVRCVYRAVELLGGWEGWVATHEVWFLALDGGVMVGAVGVFNSVHPGVFLGGGARGEEKGEGGGGRVESWAAGVGDDGEEKEGDSRPGTAV
ncbi:rta1 domain protein [Diplodia corticola]|uniref:Rta1 domain protein n=1 Tax=Diplodia corticola TaxID=236234 RepID=A0A1J9S207_9PEZI|nr:rta1 domain protein [Diplodia corticola]OJD34052.1 rta1 domain protein [Diplodia corticola]